MIEWRANRQVMTRVKSKNPDELDFVKATQRYFACWSIAVFFACGAFAQAASPILDAIQYGTLADGQVSVELAFSGNPSDPKVFRTVSPPRFILDFFGVRLGKVDKSIPVKRGVLDDIVTVDSEDRTRVIFNLLGAATVTQASSPGVVTVSFGSPQPATAAATGVSASVESKLQKETSSSQTVGDGRDEVVHIDFRRGSGGSGRVIVRLGEGVAGVDVREENSEIVLEVSSASLAPGLEKRLDVIDFATPVHYVDAFNVGSNVRIVVSAEFGYQQSAYHVGDTFTLDVSMPVESESEDGVNEFGYSGEHVRLDFQSIPIRRALDILQRQSGKNFVINPDVSGDLTMRLIDVPWDQALDIILQTNGLAQRVRGDVIWIAPSEVITDYEQKKLEAAHGQRQLQALVSELIEINYAKAEDIADILKSVRAVDTGISSTGSGSINVSEVPTETNSLLSERGSVSVDKRTNALLVQDTASKIREIRKLISALDKPVKQVLIETRIVQATDSFSRNIGIKLGFNTLNTRYGLGTIMGSGSLTGTEAIRTAGMNAASRPLAVNLPAGSPADSVGTPAAYAFTLAKAGADYANLIDLEISALEAENRGKVIANPILLTADKKEAKIEQGEERVFLTSSAGSTSATTKKAVLGLTVTPQITPDDRVILDVFVSQDSWAAGTSQNMNTNQITTQVLLHNGETVIIGGIYNHQLTESVEKVPFLGDLPILGSLFRQKTVNDKRTELLVFLTPRIIKPLNSSN